MVHLPEVRWWSPQESNQIVVLDIIASQQRFSMFHEHYTFGYWWPGTTAMSRYLYRGNEYIANPGGIGFWEPGEAHRTKQIHGIIRNAQILSVSAPFVEKLLDRSPGALSVFQSHSANTVSLLKKTLAAMSSEALEYEAQLTEFLVHWHDHYVESSPAQWRRGTRKELSTARDYIHDNWHMSFSLQDLAKASGCSPYHLAREFGKQYSLPPHSYLTHLRISRAINLLLSGESIASVAVDVGYFDQAHFSRIFRKITGYPPKKFVRSICGDCSELCKLA